MLSERARPDPTVRLASPSPTDGGSPLLAAHFLGSFRVTIDGILVDTSSRRRTRQVLAYLLAHRRTPIPRDVLAEVFWPDAKVAAARNNLHVTLTSIRQALRAANPAAVIERRFDTYRIADSVTTWTDIEQFERHRVAGTLAERRGDLLSALRSQEAACQLYEGDFLADEPYLDWAATIRDGLRLEAVEIQSRLVERYLEQCAYGPAAILARRVLAIDPCNEPVNRWLMHCYAAAGHRHLALSQYHRLVDLLWTTLRVTPSPETTALFEELRHPRFDQRARVAC